LAEILKVRWGSSRLWKHLRPHNSSHPRLLTFSKLVSLTLNRKIVRLCIRLVL
jgi:hypothetical protein